jgi:F-type H+-transporting ATPase subunit b
MIVFAAFILVTMKFIWPPIMKALDERKKKIADGLEAAEQGQRKLNLASQQSAEILQESKNKASNIIDDSNNRAGKIIEEAKERGTQENKRIVDNAKTEIAQQVRQVKETLLHEMSGMIIAGAEKIMQKDIDRAAHDKMLDELIGELEK